MVTHPFHPLSGKRFLILKTRRTGGHEILSLLAEGQGTIAMPREWTDRADPVAYSSHGPLLLSYERLVELAEFLSHLRKKTEE